MENVPLLVNFVLTNKSMKKVRQIIYFKNYFLDFFNDQTEKVKEKIDYVLFVITFVQRIPKKIL